MSFYYVFVFEDWFKLTVFCFVFFVECRISSHKRRKLN